MDSSSMLLEAHRWRSGPGRRAEGAIGGRKVRRSHGLPAAELGYSQCNKSQYEWRPQPLKRLRFSVKSIESIRAPFSTEVDRTNFGRAWQHSLARVESCSAGLLNLFNLGACLADDGSHSRVRDDKLDCNGSAAGNRRAIEWFIVDSSNNQSEGLQVEPGKRAVCRNSKAT